MANHDGPFGFRPVRHSVGGTPARMGAYSIASGLGENIYFGDLVSSTGTGVNVSLTAVAGTPVGVFAGCSYVDANGRPQFKRSWVSGTVASEVTAYVYDDPRQVFVAQSTTFANTNVGDTADHVQGTGSHTTGNSGAEIDNTTYTTGTTFKVVKLDPAVDNDYGADANVEVIFLVHELEG